MGADLYVIGNAISRGNPLLEEILNKGLPYTSGPGFLAETILPGKWVLGVSGTHGKTTTSSMLTWILEYAGMKPGFLIGGVPENFSCSARLGETPFFVIEADEYDSAFFDKRSKFVHYRPRTFIVNNLEFDHADIFADLAAIQSQFHHVIRTIPENGRVIFPSGVDAIDEVLSQGIWSEVESFSQKGSVDLDTPMWSRLSHTSDAFEVSLGSERVQVNWSVTGEHNIQNAMAAMLAARHVGVTLEHSAKALETFQGVKRRMQYLATVKGVAVYDDFAHHPTAIKTTLEGLRRRVGSEKIIALIEPRSNTMRMGIHKDTLLDSAEIADQVIWADLSDLSWLDAQISDGNKKHHLGETVESIIAQTIALASDDEPVHVVIMSNGGFGGIHQKLLSSLKTQRQV